MDCKYKINGLTLSKDEFLNYVKKQPLEESAKILGISTTPSAPFITDTNKYVQLGLRVALKEAVKQGVDKIAWTTGEQQNDRYDLSKHVDEISYFYSPSREEYDVSVIKDGKTLETKTLQENELEANFGKDVAKRMIDGEGKEYSTGLKSLTGIQLSVGGKGMKGFYGSPTERAKSPELKIEKVGNKFKVGSNEFKNESDAKKYINEYGLGIVGNVAKSLFKQVPKTVEISTTEFEKIYNVENYDEFPKEVKDLFLNLEDADDAEEIANGLKKLGYTIIDQNPADFSFTKFGKKEGVSSTQHSIDITPELKAQALQGQPLFMRTPNGVIYGAKFPDGSIYINNEDIDLSSPIHEFSHLFEEMFPELWSEGLRLFGKSSGFEKALEEVQKNPAYSNLTKEQQASEALNNLIGEKGVGYFTKGVLLSKFQNWVNKLFKTIGAKIGKQFGIKGLELNADDSLEFFVNDVLGKLLSGKELQGETQQNSNEKNIDNVMLQATSQAENITLEYNSKGEHLAPNGKPSNLSEQQAKIVRTKAFKSWFGDWENDPQNASKVVDENGEPLVVYHGGLDRITEFDERFGGDTTGNNEYGAFYFSDNKEVAEDYSRQSFIRIFEGRDRVEIENYNEGYFTEEELDELFLDESYLTENILDGWFDNNEKANIVFAFLDIKNPLVDKSQKGKTLDTEKTQRQVGFAKNGIDNEYEFDEYYQYNEETEEYSKPNLDGVVIEDVIDDIGYRSKQIQTEYITFNPNQIKLADGTNTTFNPNTNDIRFQVRQNQTQATKSEIENAISSLDVAVSDYANDDSIDNYLSLNDAFETLAYTSIGDAQNMAKDLGAKYPELKDDFNSILNEASKPKVESKKVSNESDAIRTLISEDVDGRLYPTIVDSLGKFEKKQITAETTSKVEGREVSGDYVRLTLQNMKDIATQKMLQLQEVLGEDWVEKSIAFFEREPYSGNPAIIIGLSNIISTDLQNKIKTTTDIKEIDSLVALQNRMDRVVNRNGRVASLALNYRRIFTSFAQGDSVTDAMAGNNLTDESKKQIDAVKQALAEQPTDEQLNSVGNVVTPTATTPKNTKSSRKTQTDSTLKAQIKNNAINSLTQVDANGKKSTKTWQDAVREANEESKKHKC